MHKHMTTMLLAAALALVQHAGAAERDGAGMARLLDNVAEADKDGDGRVTRQEWTDYRAARFAQMDRNGDGSIGSDDVPAMLRGRPRAQQGEQAIRLLDTDGDGKLSRAEFTGGMRLFDLLDRNRDGAIDKAELAQAREARR